ncbi:MAG: hypothetical protein ACI4V3_01030, partial [Faecousia sp.]
HFLSLLVLFYHTTFFIEPQKSQFCDSKRIYFSRKLRYNSKNRKHFVAWRVHYAETEYAKSQAPAVNRFRRRQKLSVVLSTCIK